MRTDSGFFAGAIAMNLGPSLLRCLSAFVVLAGLALGVIVVLRYAGDHIHDVSISFGRRDPASRLHALCELVS